MYLPKSFEEKDIATLHNFMRQFNFAALVTTQADHSIVATHIPLMIDSSRGELGTLTGHLARANHQWQNFSPEKEVLVIFQGPHTYISPSWYKTVPSVPTWNYAVVHVYGKPRILDGFDVIHDMLENLVKTHEAQFQKPWPMELPQEYMQSMIKSIVGFEIEITKIEGKFKLSQNRDLTDQQLVTKALEEMDDPLAKHIADMMTKAQEDKI